jgi:hypothetical protein
MQNKTVILEEKLEQALRWIVLILNKRKVEYQISGGLAAHLYGSNRPINDIDIDIPENKFNHIYDSIKDYITFGPKQFKDQRWDMKAVILNYNGQEIDIGGAYKTKICDTNKGKWVNLPANLSTAKNFNINGLEIKICNPYDLAEYKRLLKGQHQQNDIQAIEKYLSLFKNELSSHTSQHPR